MRLNHDGLSVDGPGAAAWLACALSFIRSLCLAAGGKKTTQKQFWFYWFNVGMCVFNIFSADIEKKRKEKKNVLKN